MAARDLDSDPVDRIGEYLLGPLLGEGGMGKVYEAEERLTKRRVALKVLRPELARSEEGRRLFLNEMTILAHLDHPNIVRCLSCTEADGQLVMALELLDGQTLRDVLFDRGQLGWEEATSIVCQVAAALEVAHRQEPPIIHRDLKPENIMILEDGSVKVMDFGIAKVLEAISRTTTNSVGTLQYMSPEQIDAGGVDERSDLYGLGLMLYEMLNGAPPFESVSPRELLNLQCTEEPPDLNEAARVGLPSGLERLVFQLLEKNPDDRPANAREVADRLEPFRPVGDVVPLRPVESNEPAGRTVKTEPMGTAPAPEPRPKRADTIALLERATEPRRVPLKTALAVVVALSAAAGIGTYLVRTSLADDAPTTAEASVESVP